MSSSNVILSIKEKVGYALGDTASNFFFQTFNIFLMYYYTDVYGISAAAAGTMFLVTRLFDAVNDPVMGLVADRTQTRWGKFRPYLVVMAIPYGILGYIMFSGPDLGDTGKLVFAYVSYTLMMMAYTAINIPYSALMGVMTSKSKERTILASYRFVFAFGGGFLVSMLVRPMVAYFGAESEAAGFRMTMAIFAVVSIALFWTTFATTKERVAQPLNQKSDVKKDFRNLLHNLPWLIMFISAIFVLANTALRNGAAVYYFKYFVGDEGEKFLWFFDKTSLFLTSGLFAMIAGVASTKFFNSRFDKRKLMIALTSLNAIGMGVFYMIPSDQYWTMIVVNFIATYIVGPTPALVWAMMADTVDYGEWKTNRRITALSFAAVQFAQKFGLTIGATLTGWMLAFYGFAANEVQSETALRGIRLLFTVFPAAFAIISAVIMYFYPLSDKKVAQIEEELIQRKNA